MLFTDGDTLIVRVQAILFFDECESFVAVCPDVNIEQSTVITLIFVHIKHDLNISGRVVDLTPVITTNWRPSFQNQSSRIVDILCLQNYLIKNYLNHAYKYDKHCRTTNE